MIISKIIHNWIEKLFTNWLVLLKVKYTMSVLYLFILPFNKFTSVFECFGQMLFLIPSQRDMLMLQSIHSTLHGANTSMQPKPLPGKRCITTETKGVLSIEQQLIDTQGQTPTLVIGTLQMLELCKLATRISPSELPSSSKA